jgi:carbamoyltransferase
MPFAPIVMEEKAAKYFKGYRSADLASRFMTITYDVFEDKINKIPAVVHVDGTARPQVVRSKDNKSLHKILTEYEKLTGIPVLINTSFNMHEEPIVCSPSDAIRAFHEGAVDVLAIENFLVWKD